MSGYAGRFGTPTRKYGSGRKGEPEAVGRGTGCTMAEVRRKLKSFEKRKGIPATNWRDDRIATRRPERRKVRPLSALDKKRIQRQGRG